MFSCTYYNSWTGKHYKELHSLGNMLNDDFAVCNTTTFEHIHILQAIAKLKRNKTPGLDNLCSETIKYAHGNVIPVLCLVFNAFCKHGFVCDNLCIGKLSP